MGSTRRRFTDEYKADAVALVLRDGRTIAEVARNISVSETSIGKWVKKAREENPEPEKPLSKDERAELEQLRKDNARLRMEAEFAKKVAAWFANDQQ